MAAPVEKYQPCLLDRLLNDEPGRLTESHRRRTVSLARYLAGVRRDLGWLLNASARLPGDDVYNFIEAAQSVVNFGVRDLCGLSLASLDRDQLARDLRKAILRFEPRIIPETLSVTPELDSFGRSHAILGFSIRGDIWALPYPAPLALKTEVDLETGQFLFA